MSLYDNETKIYPDLEPTAPQEPQSYWLNKLSEIETYFLDEIDARERNEKKKWDDLRWLQVLSTQA